MAEHTSGPWEVGWEGEDSAWVFAPNGHIVADVNTVYHPETDADGKRHWVEDEDVTTANAHVLAASLELLEACESAFTNLVPEHLWDYVRSYDTEEEGWQRLAERLRVIGPDFDPGYRVRAALALRAAIAKARPEEVA